MDQVRSALNWLKKHHFWVLSAIVLVVSLVTWYLAANDLNEQYEQSKQTIQQQFGAVNTLAQKPFHPNEVINQRQQEEIQRQSEEVAQLWGQLYKAQQEAVLKWPEALPARFRRQIAKLKFGDEIHESLRESYLNYAKNHFPELPKIVKALELPDDGRSGGISMGGRGGSSESFSFDLEQFEESLTEGQLPGMGVGREGEQQQQQPQLLDFIVYWQDQNKIREQLSFPTRPSSLRVWVTQEDLWVYTTLLQIIAQTNEAAGATRFSNAAVRVINSLDVGKLAAQSSREKGRILVREQTMGRGPMGERGYESDMGGGEFAGELEFGGRGGGYEEFGAMDREGGTGGEGDEAPVLLSQRYLDETGKPKAVTAGPYDATQFGVEYKRLPIRMALYMDTRWLYHLIATCANAPLQVEVQEVRINPTGGGQGMGRGTQSQRMYSLESAGARTFGVGREGAGGPAGMMSLNTFNTRPYIVPVIIQGTIYIFNEPNVEALQVGGGEA
jgi:hypothetical protein